MMSVARFQKPTGPAERRTQTTLDTVELTQALVAQWKRPPFQREIRVNANVLALIDALSRDNVIPGIITLGVLNGEVFIVDGSHRLHAFATSGLPVAYSDVRWHHFKTIAEMADEFVRLNSSLVRLRPDDLLRGLEPSTVALQTIRKQCPFVGYDQIRRASRPGPVVSMGAVVRMWSAAHCEVPSPQGSTVAMVNELDAASAADACAFLGLCFQAWERAPEFFRLWGALTLTLCGWLYLRTTSEHRPRGGRTVYLAPDEFKRGLMSLSANQDYLDYIVGRNLNDRDRSPTFARIKAIFVQRYKTDTGKKLILPAPAWATGHTGRR